MRTRAAYYEQLVEHEFRFRLDSGADVLGRFPRRKMKRGLEKIER